MGVSSPTPFQAKHIPYGMVIEAVQGLAAIPKIRIDFRGNVVITKSGYVSLQDIQNCWPTIPPKIIKEKVRKLIEKYRVLEGCACGCSTGIAVSPSPMYEVIGVYGPGGVYWDYLRPLFFPSTPFKQNFDVTDQAREDAERYE